MAALYDLFLKTDATQVEINPFAETPEGQGSFYIFLATLSFANDWWLVYCVDAKINFDDNASFRQKAVFDQGDDSETDPREVEAAKYGLNYIGMDGNIGCMGIFICLLLVIIDLT